MAFRNLSTMHWALAVYFLVGAATLACGQESHIGGLNGDASRGKELYQRYCVGCHGARGDGRGDNAAYVDPKPRDFTSGTFKCRSTPSGSIPLDSDLFDTIARGIYSTAMPSWNPLTRQQRADLVAYVKSFSSRFREDKPEAKVKIPAEPRADRASIERGQELYQNTIRCALCHGKEGRGDGPSAATLTDSKGLPIPPFDFTSSTRFKCGESDQDMYRVLMTGLDGSPMASFTTSVTPEQAWDIVHYVRTFRTEPRGGIRNLLAGKHPDASQPSGQ